MEGETKIFNFEVEGTGVVDEASVISVDAVGAETLVQMSKNIAKYVPKHILHIPESGLEIVGKNGIYYLVTYDKNCNQVRVNLKQ